MAATEPPTLLVERRHWPSLRSRVFNAVVQRVVARWVRGISGVPSGSTEQLVERTAKLDRLAARLRAPRGTRVQAVDFGEFAGEWVHGPGVGEARGRVILYLHGGAWLFGSAHTHRSLVARISAAAGVPALFVGYRMVPEVPFESVVDDCLSAYRWLLDRGVAPADVVIMGDSAGGHLTFATALEAIRAGLGAPAALVSISGCLDLDLDSKHAHANASADPVGAMAVLQFVVESIAGHLDRTDPAVSPLRADLSALPPTLLTVSSAEVLFEDSELMARRLVRAGVPCTLQIWDGQLHVFQVAAPLIPEAAISVSEIGRFVRHSFETTAVPG